MKNFTLRLWNNEIISLSLSSSTPQHKLTIYDIKKKLTELHGFRCDLLEFRSSSTEQVYHNKVAVDSLHLDEYKIINVHLLPSPDLPICYQSYDRYIHEITFKSISGEIINNKQQFQQNGIIEITFREDEDRNYLKIDDILQDSKLLRPKGDGGDEGRNMIEIFGITGAQERGFVQWTNHIIYDYIVLLDLGADSTELEKRIDSIRYKWNGINSLYWNGDPHSWQRYTKKIPISIDITPVSTTTSTTGCSKLKKVMISPKISLTPGGCYAIALLHGIPLHLNSSTMSLTPPHPNVPDHGNGIAEDKLIFFQIFNPEKKQQSSSSLASPNNGTQTKQTMDGGRLVPNDPLISQNPLLLQSPIHFVAHSYHCTHTPLEFELMIKTITTVFDLKLYLSVEYSTSPSLLIVALNENLLLQDSDSLINCNLKVRNIIRLWPSFQSPSSSSPSSSSSSFSSSTSWSHPNYSLGTSNILSSYLPYIASVTPSQNQQNVSINTAITIRFQSVSHIARGGQYHKLLEQKKDSIPSNQFTDNYSDQKFISRSLLLSCFRNISIPFTVKKPSSDHNSSGNEGNPPIVSSSLQCADMKVLLGEEEAKNRGYKCWLTDSETFETFTTLSFSPSPAPSHPHPHPHSHSSLSPHHNNQHLMTTQQDQMSSFTSQQRFYLIEIDSLEILEEKNWNRLRYKYTPWALGKERSLNGFYCEGDRYSWQRYTRFLPVMGSFVINVEQQMFIFQPSLPLYPGTTYGILLANGVPSIPSSSTSPSSVTSLDPDGDWYSIQEDLLYVFTTEGTKKDISHLDRLRWSRHDLQLQKYLKLKQDNDEMKRQKQDENCEIS